MLTFVAVKRSLGNTTVTQCESF